MKKEEIFFGNFSVSIFINWANRIKIETALEYIVFCLLAYEKNDKKINYKITKPCVKLNYLFFHAVIFFNLSSNIFML